MSQCLVLDRQCKILSGFPCLPLALVTLTQVLSHEQSRFPLHTGEKGNENWNRHLRAGYKDFMRSSVTHCSCFQSIPRIRRINNVVLCFLTFFTKMDEGGQYPDNNTRLNNMRIQIKFYFCFRAMCAKQNSQEPRLLSGPPSFMQKLLLTFYLNP